MSMTLAEIEKKICALTTEEQLRLVENLVRKLRMQADRKDIENDLAAMAADPDIQREIRQLNEEFAETESDGLEGM